MAMRSFIFVLAFAPDTEKWNQLALRVCWRLPSQSQAVQRRKSPSLSRVTSFRFAESKALEKVSSPIRFRSPVPPRLSSTVPLGSIGLFSTAWTGLGSSSLLHLPLAPGGGGDGAPAAIGDGTTSIKVQP